MKRFLINLSLNHPKMVVLVSLIITILLGLQIPKIKIDTDPENMLPADEEVRVFHDEVKEAFGLHDWLVLGIIREEGIFNQKSLGRVYRITEKIKGLDGVMEYDIIAPSEVDDIFTTDEGILRVETLLDEEPETQAQAEQVLVRIKDNPIFRNKLASDDGTTVVVFVPLENKEVADEVANSIREIIAEEGGDEEYHIAGIPVAESTFGAEMFIQMAIYAPIAFVLIFLIMLYFFRKPVVVLSPMIVALMTVTWTMGLLIGLGYTVHIMSSMIPIFLIPIAVLDSIHILSEFHDRYARHGEMRQTVVETMDELFVPMLFTSVTTVVGFSSLVLTPIPPVQVFGVFVAIGIAVAWILSITFNTSFAMLVPKKAIDNFGATPEGRSVMRSAMHLIRDTSMRYSKPIVILGATFMVISIVGLTRVVVNDNPVKWFKAGHPLRVADDVMSRHLAGTYLTYLSVDAEEEGGLKDPEAMRYVESLQRNLGTHPNVGATTSVADIVKKVGEELKGDPSEAIIPSSSEEIAQYLFLYEMSGGDPEDLFKFITPEAGRANIWVQMKKGENQAVSSVVRETRSFLENNPPPGLEVNWAGLPYINVVWQDKMVTGMGRALASSFVVVLIIMTILFRSFRLGLLSMVPLSATIALVYAFIGYIGKPYDMPIAVLSSLTLGLSIDFAIHFLQRTREAMREKGNFRAAMEEVFEIPARAITRNIMVISLGFVPMFFAHLVPYITVGAFFFAIMIISGFTTLFALPAILAFAGTGFLLGKDSARPQRKRRDRRSRSRRKRSPSDRRKDESRGDKTGRREDQRKRDRPVKEGRKKGRPEGGKRMKGRDGKDRREGAGRGERGGRRDVPVGRGDDGGQAERAEHRTEEPRPREDAEPSSDKGGSGGKGGRPGRRGNRSRRKSKRR